MLPSPMPPANLATLAAEHRQLWPLLPALHLEIGKLADKAAVRACAKRLGMLASEGGRQTVSVDHEAAMDAFQDYLIYMYRPRGLSLTQQLRNRNRYPQGSDRHRLLIGMAQARFSIFWIKEPVAEGGLIAFDIISGQDFFILDPALPRQDLAGILTGLRIFPHENVWMHTGASLALGQIEDSAALASLGKTLSPEEERQLNEDTIRRWRQGLGQTGLA